jgi:hypothetical protein
MISGFWKPPLMARGRGGVKLGYAMRWCLARFYYFMKIGYQVRKIRTPQFKPSPFRIFPSKVGI